MKKILSIVSLFLLFLSCGKEPNTPDPGPSGGGSGSGGGDANEITDITLPAPLLLLDAAGDGGLLEVKLSPSGCTTDMLNVKVTPEGIVDWERRSGGIFFTPKKIGEASVTLSAKSGPASSRQATVRVLSSEDYASTAISKITLSSSEVYLKEGDTQGKVVGVTLEPSSATSQMLKFSGATDLVTVSAVEGGIKFVPKKVGTGSVQVQPRKGSAAAQSVAVVVLSKDAYSDYVISNISSSPASVEVTDETTANVTLTLEPSAAALKDLIIASQDETVATVAEGSGTTLVVTGKKPGSTKILVRGIREGSKSIEIPVTVYGHVTSISFNAGERYDLLKGNTESLYYTIEKSGKMKNEPTVSWSATGSLVSVSGGKITGNAAGGDATYSTVTAKAGNCSASIKVYVYDTATGVEFDDFVGNFDLVPIDTIGRVLVVVAQLSADRRSGIQFDGLFPSAVWFGIGVEAVRGKIIDQLVAADARVAILPDVVGACRYIGDFEDDGGVAAIAIHILRRAPRNVGPIGIECVEIEAAQTQGLVALGLESEFAILGHLDTEPIGVVAIVVELIAHSSRHCYALSQEGCLLPDAVGFRVAFVRRLAQQAGDLEGAACGVVGGSAGHLHLVGSDAHIGAGEDASTFDPHRAGAPMIFAIVLGIEVEAVDADVADRIDSDGGITFGLEREGVPYFVLCFGEASRLHIAVLQGLCCGDAGTCERQKRKQIEVDVFHTIVFWGVK